MYGKYGVDASGQKTYELPNVPAKDYLRIRDLLVSQLDLAPEGELVAGLDVMFQDFRKENALIGIEWDNWSGLILVAKSEEGNALLTNAVEILEGIIGPQTSKGEK